MIEPEELAPGIDALERALRKDGVRLVCLFGSLAEGRPGRDVDLAVLFHNYDFDRYIEFLELARRTLGADAVDVTVLNRASAPIRLRALLEGRVIYAEDESVWSEAVAEALFDYEDYRRFTREYRPMLERRCKEGLSMAAREVDRDRVEAYLSTLDEVVGNLRRLGERFDSFEAFQADVDTRELCVHYLRIALESVPDICRHFLAVKGVSLAELDTTNLIELAGEKGLLEPSFAHKIRGMAGMRNAIGHVYWRLDYEAIYRAVTEGLRDLDEFARRVRDYLES